MPPRKTENRVPAWVRRRRFCRSIHRRVQVPVVVGRRQLAEGELAAAE
jgi:hypothetical protein